MGFCPRPRSITFCFWWIHEWMRKSSEIKLSLFSHQKQQHVMMIITRPLLDLLFSSAHNGTFLFCEKRKLMGVAGVEEISYSQLFAHNGETTRKFMNMCDGKLLRRHSKWKKRFWMRRNLSYFLNFVWEI